MATAPWWKSGVIYQVYVRSWADSNDDGVGDLRGVIAHLDHLEWLGIDGIWLSPTMPSPNADWGYDVSDYCDVHPDFGTMEDMDQLVVGAAERGIRVILDLVPNHTSDRHRWFEESRSSRSSSRRDWYVWSDPKEDGSPPNNWLSVFGGPAWELDPSTGQYYLHNFLAAQPDLNWWNEQVRDAFDDVLAFWFHRGVAGFRIDVAHGIVKDKELRDNLASTETDPPNVRRVGQRQTYNMNRPEVHALLKRWRAACDGFDPQRVLIGETWVLELERLASFYGSGSDELHLAFNFPLLLAPFEADRLREVVEGTESLIPPEAWPVWTGSNHDVGRFPTRWCGGQEGRIRCALLVLLTLRGTPFLYYGDEIGMLDRPMSLDEIRDPVGKAFWPDDKGRDSCRTPMHWRSSPGAGFTGPEAVPWLPLGDYAQRNVSDQRADPASTLSFCRDAIALRRSAPDLQTASYRSIEAPPGVWAFARGSRFVVVVNLSGAPAELDGLSGRVRLGTNRARDGEKVADVVGLGAWEGLVLERAG